MSVNPRLKILTSNQPASTRGVVSAARTPHLFNRSTPKMSASLSDPPQPIVEFDDTPRVQRVIERPFKKEKEGKNTFQKSVGAVH